MRKDVDPEFPQFSQFPQLPPFPQFPECLTEAAVTPMGPTADSTAWSRVGPGGSGP